ncbi:hypothetical protein C0Q70_10700 [Pomacea canaliculata]|uniref:Uncharacterized protein n=1 Tax=Pomacea canaliculata TaxID=400727 RepID=A0A2T7P3Y0_POMCA|nr:hypothetical protein C0Q70_10700 [Pomacea canaliculata]
MDLTSLTRLQTDKNDLEVALSAMTRKTAELEASLEDLEKKCCASDKSVVEIKAVLQNEREKIADLEASSSELLSLQQDLQANLSATEKLLASANQNLERSFMEKDELENTILEKDTIVQKMEAERDVLKQELEEKDLILKEQEMKLGDLKLELLQSMEQQSALTAQNDQLIKDLRSVVKEKEDIQEQLSQLKHQRNEREEKIQEMERQLKSGHQHVETVQTELGEAIAELTRKGSELQYIKEQWDSLQKESNDGSRRIEDLENVVEQLQNMAARLKEEKQLNDQTLTSNLEKVNTALFEERTKTGKIQKEMRELKSALQAVKSKFMKIKGEKNHIEGELLVNVKEERNSRESLSEQVLLASTAFTTLKSNLEQSELQNQNESLGSDLSKMAEKLSAVESRVQKYIDAMVDLEQQVCGFIEDKTKAREERDLECTKLREEMNNIREQITEDCAKKEDELSIWKTHSETLTTLLEEARTGLEAVQKENHVLQAEMQQLKKNHLDHEAELQEEQEALKLIQQEKDELTTLSRSLKDANAVLHQELDKAHAEYEQLKLDNDSLVSKEHQTAEELQQLKEDSSRLQEQCALQKYLHESFLPGRRKKQADRKFAFGEKESLAISSSSAATKLSDEVSRLKTRCAGLASELQENINIKEQIEVQLLQEKAETSQLKNILEQKMSDADLLLKKSHEELKTKKEDFESVIAEKTRLQEELKEIREAHQDQADLQAVVTASASEIVELNSKSSQDRLQETEAECRDIKSILLEKNNLILDLEARFKMAESELEQLHEQYAIANSAHKHFFRLEKQYAALDTISTESKVCLNNTLMALAEVLQIVKELGVVVYSMDEKAKTGESCLEVFDGCSSDLDYTSMVKIHEFKVAFDYLQSEKVQKLKALSDGVHRVVQEKLMLEKEQAKLLKLLEETIDEKDLTDQQMLDTQTVCQTLQEEIGQLTQELEEVKVIVVGKESHLEKVQEVKKGFESDFQQFRSTLTSLMEEKQQLCNENEHLMTKLVDFQAILDLEKDFHLTQIKNLEEEIKRRLEIEKQEQAARTDAQNEKMKDLQSSLNEKVSSHLLVNQQLEDLTSQLAAMQDELVIKTALLQEQEKVLDLEQSLLERTDEVESRDKELEAQFQKMLVFKENILELNYADEEKRSELETLRAHMDEALDKVHNLQSERDEMEERLLDSQVYVQRSELRLEQLESLVQNLEAEVHEWKKKFQETRDVLISSESHFHTCQTENNDLASQLLSVEVELKEKQKEVSGLMEQLERMEFNLANKNCLEEDLQVLRTELQECRKNLDLVVAECSDLKQNLNESEAQELRLQQSIEEKDDIINGLTAEAMSLSRTKTDLEACLQFANENVIALKGELEMRDEALVDKRVEIDDLANQMHSLRAELTKEIETRNCRIDDLEKKLEGIGAELTPSLGTQDESPLKDQQEVVIVYIH